MSEISDDFNAIKEYRQKKRASNRENSALLLTEQGFSFVSKNNEAHLIVENKVDFWPGTGRWISRTGERGFGVFKLIDFLRRK